MKQNIFITVILLLNGFDIIVHFATFFSSTKEIIWIYIRILHFRMLSHCTCY